MPVCGFAAVKTLEKINAHKIQRLYFTEEKAPLFGGLCKKMAAAKKPYNKVQDPEELEKLSGTVHHQGVVAMITPPEILPLNTAITAMWIEEKQDAIILDRVGNSNNLGAIIRTAECAGAHGIIIPKRRSVSLTWAVSKASAGALEYMPVVRVTNLAATLDELKERGVWIYSADMDGKPYFQTDFSGAVGLVIGSEGNGVGKLIREKSDFIVSLPLKGKINSLNASVAAGILMYEVARQRQCKG